MNQLPLASAGTRDDKAQNLTKSIRVMQRFPRISESHHTPAGGGGGATTRRHCTESRSTRVNHFSETNGCKHRPAGRQTGRQGTVRGATDDSHTFTFMTAEKGKPAYTIRVFRLLMNANM